MKENMSKKKARKRAFWKIMADGMLAGLALAILTGYFWFLIQSGFVTQVKVQMAYLSVLSGYQMKEPVPEQTRHIASELALFTTITEGREGRASEWMFFLGADDKNEPGSYLYRLVEKYPNAISEAMNGDTTLAQKLEAKWLKDRNIRFFPFGMTLMLLFLTGLIITILASVYKSRTYPNRAEASIESIDW